MKRHTFMFDLLKKILIRLDRATFHELLDEVIHARRAHKLRVWR